MDRRFFRNGAVGAAAGYLVYLVIIAGFELFGDGGFDIHRFLYAARVVIYVPQMASRSFRGEFTSDQIVNGLLLIFLVATGTVTSVWMGTKSRKPIGSASHPQRG